MKIKKIVNEQQNFFMFPFVSRARIFLLLLSVFFLCWETFYENWIWVKKIKKKKFFVFVLTCTKGSATMKHFRFLLAPSPCKMSERIFPTAKYFRNWPWTSTIRNLIFSSSLWDQRRLKNRFFTSPYSVNTSFAKKM